MISSSAQEKVSSLKSDIKSLKKNLKESKTQATSITDELKGKINVVEAKNQEISELQIDFKGLNDIITEKMEIISATKAELEEVKKMNKEIKVLEDRVDNLNNDVDTLRQKNATAYENNEHLSQEIEETRETTHRRINELIQENGVIPTLTNNVSKLSKEVALLKAGTDADKSTIESLEIENKEIAVLENKVEQLTGKV